MFSFKFDVLIVRPVNIICRVTPQIYNSNIQQMQLIVITIGQTESEEINRMITITGCFYLVSWNKWDYEKWSDLADDNINQW